MRISDWSSDVCSSDLTTLAMSPKKQAGVSFSCRLPCNMSKSPTKSWQGLQRCALVTLSSTEHPWQTLKKTFYRFKWCPVVFTRQATHAGFFRKAAFPNTSKRTGRQIGRAHV